MFPNQEFWFIRFQISLPGDSELILSLDAEWIKEPTGTDSNTGTYSYYSQSELRDHSDFAKRGIRGLRLKASEYSPPGMDSGDPLNCFWFSYRRSATYQKVWVYPY